MNLVSSRTGGCFCGAVTYRIDGPVFGARLCHCSRCRKAFSAQANAYALIDPGSLTWTRGEDLLTAFPADSDVGKRFCRVCGSTLCGVVDGMVHGITLGCLDNDEGIEIEAHIYVGSKASWEVIPDGAPAFETIPPEWCQSS